MTRRRVDLSFPALLEPLPDAGYRVRPLLCTGPSATRRRLDAAVAAFRTEIERHLGGTSLDRDALEALSWYRFSERVQFDRLPIDEHVGGAWLNGRVAVARFEVGEARYACLPKFDHLTLMLDATDTRAAHDAAIRAAAVRYVRNRDDERDAQALARKYLSARGESVVQVELAARVANEPFPFERRSRVAFDALFDMPEFDGETELERVGHRLNARYPETLRHAFGREPEVDELARRMFSETPRCVALIGPRGVGKTTVVEAAVASHLDALEPKDRRKARVAWYLDPGRVIAGMSVVGSWQRRFEAMLDALLPRARRTRADLLYVDNVLGCLHVGRSAQNSLTLADVLRPHLASRALPMLVEATPQAWDAALARNRRFADLFEVVRLDAPPYPDAVRMLNRRRAALEAEHGARFTTAAFLGVVRGAREAGARARGEQLPGSASRVLERLVARRTRPRIDVSAVEQDAREARRLSVNLTNLAEAQTYDARRALLDAELVGQPEAKRCLANAMSVARAGLAEPGRLLASLLFVGPSGVGKTEAAKALSRLMFEGEDSLLRFDMNEFADAGAVGRLIGDAWQPVGQLTSRVRERRAAVLLFDEIEKAHPDVHDLLLQVLDDARLSDANGDTTDFGACVIVLTSNLGAAEARRVTGFAPDAQDTARSYLEAVQRFFRPELFNRIDACVPFDVLSADDAQVIAERELARLLARDGFVRRAVFLDIKPQALRRITLDGFDGALGARALKRALEREVVAACARAVVGVAAELPLLLSLDHERGRAKTDVRSLRYAARRDEAGVPPPPTAVVDAFETRADELLGLRQRLEALVDAASASRRIRLWQLRERIVELAERIDQVCIDIEGWRGAARRGEFRLRRASQLNRDWARAGFRVAARDIGAQMDIVEYFEQLSRDSTRLSTLTDVYWLELDVEYRYLGITLDALSAGTEDGLRIDVEAMSGGREACRHAYYLARQYERVVEHVDGEVVYERGSGHDVDGEPRYVLRMTGPGLERLLGHETGVQLFETPRGGSVAVAVRTTAAESPAGDTRPDEIIRLFRHEPFSVSDLRTGLVCPSWMRPQDWMLMLSGVTASPP